MALIYLSIVYTKASYNLTIVDSIYRNAYTLTRMVEICTKPTRKQTSILDILYKRNLRKCMWIHYVCANEFIRVLKYRLVCDRYYIFMCVRARTRGIYCSSLLGLDTGKGSLILTECRNINWTVPINSRESFARTRGKYGFGSTAFFPYLLYTKILRFQASEKILTGACLFP